MIGTTGYHRNDDGSLARVQLLLDGDTICDRRGYPLIPTEEIAELKGWGADDGPARVYRNDGGRELLLPVSQAPRETTGHGTLHDLATGEELRPATAEEEAHSIRAARLDGGHGIIEVDGRSCYVQ